MQRFEIEDVYERQKGAESMGGDTIMRTVSLS